MKWMCASFGLLLLFPALPACAQSPAAGSTPATSAKPADAPASPAASTVPEKKKPKKVWTNDEIGSVKGGVSVVGDGDSPTATNSGPTSAASSDAIEAHQKLIENYRHRIQEYQTQIESVDKRISQLKNFKAEDSGPSGGINMNQGYNMVPLEDQVKQLEEKKRQLQTKIADVESEARQDGIDSGDLR
jgi:hypothetical protein